MTDSAPIETITVDDFVPIYDPSANLQHISGWGTGGVYLAPVVWRDQSSGFSP